MATRIEAPTRNFLASEAMVAGRAVTLSSTANTVGYANAGDKVAGILERDVASGEQAAVRLVTAEGTHKITMDAAASVGDKVAVAASGKFSATAAGASNFILLAAASGDGSVVEALYVPESGSSLVYTSLAASSAIAGISTETAYDVSFTLPANSLEAGDVLDIWAQGIITGQNSTDTHTFKLKIGSTAVCTTGAPDSATNDIFIMHARVTVRTAGASGTLVGSGLTFNGTPGAAAGAADIPSGHFVASTAINTQATQAITVTSTVSAADANNTSRLDMLQVVRHRR